ncbi:MAG TPA: insulinase family protein [Bacteroidales bacterium]|jgi:zinc protease|nr:insulinase family protein [Bacteroidales bacterium]HOS15419.1 insulinase family protein [Bacteroidales bacterium]
MTKLKLFLTTLVCFLTTISYSQQQIDLEKELPVDPKVKIGKLDNGLVYYIRKNKKPEKRVELRLAVKAGSMQETDEQVGLAHFTEHMAFNGSKHFKKNELVSYLQSIGMRFGGDLNAYTSFDETVYMLTVPTDSKGQLDSGFLVLQDWAANLSLEGKEIDAERGVIIEEWRTGKNADERMRKVWFPIVFTNSLYAKRMPIGTYENLKSFKHETLRNFYKTWYRPNLQAIIVVGDIDVNYAEEKIKALFSSLQNPENAPEKIMHPIGENKEVLIARATDKEATYSQIMTIRKHKGFRPKTIQDYRTSLMLSLYNMMINDRFDELQQDPKCPVIGAGSYYNQFVGNVDAYTGYAIAKENQMKEAMLLLMREEERVKQFGFLESEFERAKEELMSSLEKAANEAEKTFSSSFAGEYVSHFLNESPIMGAKISYNQAKKLIETIKVEEISKLAKQWITDENFVIVILGPEKEGLNILTEDEARNILKKAEYKNVTAYVDNYKPEPLIDKELTGSKVKSSKELPDIQATEYVLENGIKVILKPTEYKDDEVLMMAKAPGGSSLFSLYDFPSTMFATALVERSGLGNFDYISLEKKLKGKNVGISPVIGETWNGFYGNTTPKDFETMLQLLYLYYDAPRFDEQAFQAIISETKNQLKFISGNPMYVFLDTLIKTSSQNDPRKIAIPDEAFLNNATYKQSIDVYKDRFSNAGNLVFTFVGNINKEEMLPLIEKYIGSLPVIDKKDIFKNVYYGFPDETKDLNIYVGMEDKSTMGIIFSEEYEWNLKNNLCLDIFQEILDIRLVEIIREKMGGTYSPSLQFSYEKYPETSYTAFVMINCEPKKVKKISKTVFDIFNKLLAKGFTKEELQKATEQIKKSLQVNFEKNAYWRNYIDEQYFNGDPLNEYKDYLKLLDEITPEELLKTIKPLFKTEHYVSVYQYPEKKK